MKKKAIQTILKLLLLVFSTSVISQNASTWSKISKQEINVKALNFRKSNPKKAFYFSLNINELKHQLVGAPIREDIENNKITVVSFPNSNGKLERFKIVEASVMDKALQKKYANLKSYAGESLDYPGSLIRFSITNKGLHSMSFSPRNGTQYIDPYTKDGKNYIVYAKKDLPALSTGFNCLYENTNDDKMRLSNIDGSESLKINANDGILRAFRIAIATTTEYSQYHWLAAGLNAGDTEAAKKAAVMDAIVVTLTRNNFIYERDLSMTMTLVENNDAIIFVNDDNFNNDNPNLLIGQSQAEIDRIIGNANYDIGHTFSTGGGGVAQLNSPCVTGSKARGITGSPAPEGDPYDIDFVAHELGHQFGSPHTFNSSTGNCAGTNRSPSSAYEVASGTTIMAYAGICAPQNVQNNSDAYFHQRSLFLMFNNLTFGNSTCANLLATGNTAPTANAGTDFTVPVSTPYKLLGASTDVNGIATHTYTWEQYDLGSDNLPSETNTTGPMVRSFEGTNNPARFIPNLIDLQSSNGGSTTWEVLPSVSRTQNFRLTVRDNDVRGGNTAVDNMTINFNNSAGPFKVTSQNTSQIVWTPGNTETITWDVANTDVGVASSATVNILLSTDNGLTYDTVLASNVLNDGSEDIVVPNITAPYCRIMVEAAENIFFNINSEFLAIGNYNYGSVDECLDYTITPGTIIQESTNSFTVFPINVPDSRIITDLNVSVDISHNSSGDLFISVAPPSGGQNRMVSASCVGPQNALIVTYDDEGGNIDCTQTNINANIIPSSVLTFADGRNSAGPWLLLITDITEGDGNVAILNSATLNICSSSIQPTLNTNNFESKGINTFTIYPNPNRGEFTVSLPKTQSSNVQLEVHDIRGRTIFNRSYGVSGTLNEAVNLGFAQAGIYLVTIQDGDFKTTKKVVIE